MYRISKKINPIPRIKNINNIPHTLKGTDPLKAMMLSVYIGLVIENKRATSPKDQLFTASFPATEGIKNPKGVGQA